MRSFAVLTLALLTACDGSEAPATTPSTTETPSSTEPPATSGPSSTGSGTTSTPDVATADTAEAPVTCAGTPEVVNLTPQELYAMLQDKDFELINVHVPYEGELPDTDAHVKYTETDALEDHLGHDLAAKAVLYCKTGPMSKTATQNLVDRGYCRIYDLPAGMNGWTAAGYDLLFLQ